MTPYRLRGAAARARQPIRAGWGQHPDLPASLRALVYDYRYTHADVARMFGVTPQRVSQWCKTFGIHAPKMRNAARIWSEQQAQFIVKKAA